jgi:hypothetical protein
MASTLRRCRSPKISIWSVSSVRTVNTRRSAKQFARGHRGGILTTSIPASANTASNEAANCPARSPDQEPEPGDVFVEVEQEVAGLLRGPGPVGVRGHAQHVQVAITDLGGDQDVEPPQCHRAVDVEEVDGQHAGGLGT